MPVAGLSIVQLRLKRSELGTILAELISFKDFHPSKRDGLIQDVGILLLSSRFQSIYSNASELLASDALRIPKAVGTEKKKFVERFDASDVINLAERLEQDLDTAKRNLPIFITDEDKEALLETLQAIRDLSVAMFHNLDRILVVPDVTGYLTLEGYVPSSSVQEFEGNFGEHVIKVQPISKRGKQDPYVPSLLVNTRVISLFESLTLMKGVPKYNEIDPTPIIALVFPFFFGIMFGDVGHGLALFSFGVYLLRKTKYDYWGKLILVFGISATLFGFIRGSFFGLSFTSPLQDLVKLPEVFSAHFTLSYIPLLLEIAIIIGTFHLASAYAIGFLNAIRSADYVEGFLDRLPTLTLYASLVALGIAVVGNNFSVANLLSSKIPTPVFNQALGLYVPISLTASVSLVIVSASLVLLLVGQPVAQYISAKTRKLRRAIKVLESSIIEVAAKSFEFFMNTISYVRLGVLLIATTLLGSLIAGFLNYGIIGIFLAIFSNIAVLSLEGVILYIQEMRLHLYEWLPKFYSGSGTPFTPLVNSGENFQINFLLKQNSLMEKERVGQT